MIDRELAKQLRAEGLTLREIGERFGVTKERISQVLGRPGSLPKALAPRKRRRRCLALTLLCKAPDCLTAAAIHGFCRRCFQRWRYYNQPGWKDKQNSYSRDFMVKARSDPEKAAALKARTRAANARHRERVRLGTVVRRKA